MSDSLKHLRERIDSIDTNIQELITERASIAQQVAIAKQQQHSTIFYRAEREAEVLRMVMQRNEGPLRDEEMARLFREIMSACLALEQPMTIAFLGPEGTFTQSAALKHFGHSVISVPLTTISDVFREVESDSAHYGVVPVENSTEGVINHTLDLFINSPLQICGEVELRIHHHLLVAEKHNKPDNSDKIAKISTIYSHRQSLAQCREWLDTHMKDVPQITVDSNAEAARLVANSQSCVAAIAGETAAKIYQLDVIERNIEDELNNTTRFLIIGKSNIPPSGQDKTTMLVSAQNKSGTLYSLLEPIARHQLSLSRIESRPSRKGLWEYVFFMDIEGHKDDDNVAQALLDLEDAALMVKVLGSYPKAVL